MRKRKIKFIIGAITVCLLISSFPASVSFAQGQPLVRTSLAKIQRLVGLTAYESLPQPALTTSVELILSNAVSVIATGNNLVFPGRNQKIFSVNGKFLNDNFLLPLGLKAFARWNTVLEYQFLLENCLNNIRSILSQISKGTSQDEYTLLVYLELLDMILRTPHISSPSDPAISPLTQRADLDPDYNTNNKRSPEIDTFFMIVALFDDITAGMKEINPLLREKFSEGQKVGADKLAQKVKIKLINLRRSFEKALIKDFNFNPPDVRFYRQVIDSLVFKLYATWQRLGIADEVTAQAASQSALSFLRGDRDAVAYVETLISGYWKELRTGNQAGK